MIISYLISLILLILLIYSIKSTEVLSYSTRWNKLNLTSQPLKLYRWQWLSIFILFIIPYINLVLLCLYLFIYFIKLQMNDGIYSDKWTLKKSRFINWLCEEI